MCEREESVSPADIGGELLHKLFKGLLLTQPRAAKSRIGRWITPEPQLR